MVFWKCDCLFQRGPFFGIPLRLVCTGGCFFSSIQPLDLLGHDAWKMVMQNGGDVPCDYYIMVITPSTKKIQPIPSMGLAYLPIHEWLILVVN